MTENKKGCWYHLTRYECPLCAHSDEIRERREGPKPKDDAKRYSYRTIAYHCGYM